MDYDDDDENVSDVDGGHEDGGGEEWKAVYDANYDQYYYYNTITDTVTWVLPKGATVSQWIKPQSSAPAKEQTPSMTSNTTGDDDEEEEEGSGVDDDEATESQHRRKPPVGASAVARAKQKRRAKQRSRLPVRKGASSNEHTPEIVPRRGGGRRAKERRSSDDRNGGDANGGVVPMRMQRRHHRAVRSSSDDVPPSVLVLEAPSRGGGKRKPSRRRGSSSRDREEKLDEHDDRVPLSAQSSFSGDEHRSAMRPQKYQHERLMQQQERAAAAKRAAKGRAEPSEDNMFEVEPGSPEHTQFSEHTSAVLDVLTGRNTSSLGTRRAAPAPTTDKSSDDSGSMSNLSGVDGVPQPLLAQTPSSASSRRRATVSGSIVDHQVGIHLLATGQTFFKFGNHGKPHLKFVRVDMDGNVIYVDALTQKKKPDVKGFHIRDVISIHSGKQTKVFRQRGGKTEDELCFSLVCKNRTLDLQAQTVAVRDTWVNVLNVYLAKFKNQTPIPAVLRNAVSDPDLRSLGEENGQYHSDDDGAARGYGRDYDDNNHHHNGGRLKPPAASAVGIRLRQQQQHRPLTRDDKAKYEQMYERVRVSRNQSMSYQPNSMKAAAAADESGSFHRSSGPDVRSLVSSLAGTNSHRKRAPDTGRARSKKHHQGALTRSHTEHDFRS